MTTTDVIRHRVFNQQIAETKFTKPEEIVNWLVAMQAQEYAMAKWSIGLRLPGSTDEMVENTFTQGAILRTHLDAPYLAFCSSSRYTLAAKVICTPCRSSKCFYVSSTGT